MEVMCGPLTKINGSFKHVTFRIPLVYIPASIYLNIAVHVNTENKNVKHVAITLYKVH